MQLEKYNYLFVSETLKITTASSAMNAAARTYKSLEVDDVLNIEIKDITMEAKKFKIGDKVRVKSLEWYNSNKNAEGKVYKDGISDIYFTKEMAFWCRKIVQIEKIYGDTYYLVDGSFCHWQDWMLEDEVVTEEKQEVELYKNDMAKEMTKEQVFEFLKNTKVLCTSTEETKKVQKKLFELNYKFVSGFQAVKEDIYLLYIYNGGVLQYGTDLGAWMSDTARKIEPSEILKIKIKEDKPRFSPAILRPFDKVLVRDKENDKWRCNLFCHINEGLIRTYSCVFNNWIYCIPYNEETKSLVGTGNEAPEFYRI